MDLFGVSYLLLWFAVIVQGLVILFLLRQVGTIYLGSRDAIERDGINVGVALPPVIGRTPDGRDMRLALDDRWTAFIYAAPTCQICRELMPELKGLIDSLRREVRFVLILQGAAETLKAYEESVGVTIEALAVEQSMARLLRVRVSPFVHVVDPENVVRAKGLVNSLDHVEHLLVTAGVEHVALKAHVDLRHGVVA